MKKLNKERGGGHPLFIGNLNWPTSTDIFIIFSNFTSLLYPQKSFMGQKKEIEWNYLNLAGLKI